MPTLPVAAPVEVVSGGRTYRFAKLNLEDWAAFSEHLKADMRQQVKDADLPPAEKQKLYRELILRPMDVDVMLGFVSELPSMRWLLHRSVCRHHDDVTIDGLGEIVGTIASMTELVGELVDMPETDDGDWGEPASDPPT